MDLSVADAIRLPSLRAAEEERPLFPGQASNVATAEATRELKEDKGKQCVRAEGKAVQDLGV